MAWAYYNENDPFAAAWLECLIWEDLIAPGDVDRRSIEDVTANDLRGYDQHHFFAGIGGWSAALRLAEWPDDRPVWTGSCPCQPFSAAGKGGGFADERHLWPAWHWLLRQHRPDIVLGEQVAAKAGLGWFDLVSSDLEGEGYTVGAADTCAAGVGAPHIRQRLYWLGVAPGSRCEWVWRQPTFILPGQAGEGHVVDPESEQARLPRRAREPGSPLADDDDARLEVLGEQPARSECPAAERGGETCPLGYSQQQRPQGSGDSGGCEGMGEPRPQPAGTGTDDPDGHACALQHPEGDGREQRRAEPVGGSVAGFWREADCIPCRDGKWRPVEPGTFPLASGIPGRVGALRGYGNSINVPLAAAFIESVMDAL